MKHRILLPVLLLSLALSGCGGLLSPAGDQGLQAEARRLASVQLGKLEEHLTQEEHRKAVELLEWLLPLRKLRQASGAWEPTPREEHLVSQLNQLYEAYTRKYLGEPETWRADEEKMEVLAEYDVRPGAVLEPTQGADTYRDVWAQVAAMLPPGSLQAFDRFTVFTDGEDEILAYVAPTDDAGARWELAVDPQDMGDQGYFAETVFHEYCHYLTLNSGQVTYGETTAGERYAEEGMTAHAGSYLDDFYQAFWKDYLEDRRAAPDSSGFYLRHADDFLTGYAATSPSEDIAESFAFFVLYDRAEGEGLAAQKQNFFYAYPQLVDFRNQAREGLGL